MYLTIHTRPPAEMRYVTVGDWQFPEVPEGDPWELRIQVIVAETGVPRYNMLIGVHELVEAIIVGFQHGFSKATSRMVDQFDMNWHNEANYDEPGDDPAAPYHEAHVVATIVERVLAYTIGVNWQYYSDHLDKMTEAMERAREPKTAN